MSRRFMVWNKYDSEQSAEEFEAYDHRAAEACGLTVPQLRLQLRIAAIYADRERELRPSVRPVAWIACGPKREEPRATEGRLVA